MCGCESWTIKKAESWIFIGRTDAEAEAPILWPPDGKSWLIKKTLMLGKIEGRRRKGWQRMRWLDELASPTWWMWVWTSSGSWWWTGKPGVLQSMTSQRVGHDWVNWSELRNKHYHSHFHRKICKRIKHLQKSHSWFCVICWLLRSLILFFAPSCAKARWQMLVGFKRSQWAVHIGWVKISGTHLLMLYFFQMTLELF